MMNAINEDVFKAYAEQKEREAKLASSRGNGTFQKDYESIKYCGLKLGEPTIVRVVGGPINSGVTPYTAKRVTLARIVDDNGKLMKVCRPSFTEDSSYILNKIISKVRTTKWVKGEDGKTSVKTFPVKEQYPDLYNQIEKNGLKATDKRFMYDKGWLGSEVIMMNIIDRGQMDWHRANKHTMLLAKSVTEKDGNEYAEEGISSYAASPKLDHYLNSYGSWEKYDLAISRTGDMNNAYNIVCASETPKEVPSAYRDLISSNPYLTSEEMSWETYDLTKLYKYTSATKIYNRLKNTIRRIDGILGTDFITELEALVAEEEKARAETDAETPDVPNTEVSSAPISTMRTRGAAASIPNASEPGACLPYYTTLSPSMRAKIVSAKKSGDTWEIEWNVPYDSLYECERCYAPSPGEVTVCPACGKNFLADGTDGTDNASNIPF